MVDEPVVLINAFEVPPGDDEEFVAAWEHAKELLRTQPGFIDAALHRSLGPDAEFRYVNVARWASPAAFRAATNQPEFRALRVPYAFHAGLYHVVAAEGADQ